MKNIKDLFKKPVFIAFLVIAISASLYMAYVFSGTQTTHVDGESMAPTLDNGQVLFVDIKKEGYGYGYGDVVILWTESTGTIVKRIVGLPGDKIVFKNHMVYRNGKLVSEFHSKKAMKHMEMPNEAEYEVNLADGKTTDENPEYYVMGDNLSIANGESVSVDSRQLGAIPSKDLMGKVYFH